MRTELSLQDLDDLKERLLRFVAPGNASLNRLMAKADGGRVSWSATDSYRLARLCSGHSDSAGIFALPARVLMLAWQIGHARDEQTVTIEVDLANSSGALSLPGVMIPFDPDPTGFPEVESFFEEAEAPEVTVTLTADDLFAVLHAARLAPSWLSPEARGDFWLSISADQKRLKATHDGTDIRPRSP